MEKVLSERILKKEHPLYDLLDDQIKCLEHANDHQAVQRYNPVSYYLSTLLQHTGGAKAIDIITGAPFLGTGQRGKRPVDVSKVMLFLPRPSTTRRMFPSFSPYFELSKPQLNTVAKAFGDGCKEIGIVLDEAELRSNVYYYRNTHQLVGFQGGPIFECDVEKKLDPNNIEHALVKGVYALIGVTSDGSAAFPIGTYATNGSTSGPDLAKVIIDLADKFAECDPQIQVKWISTDGGGPNKSLEADIRSIRPELDIVQIFVSSTMCH